MAEFVGADLTSQQRPEVSHDRTCVLQCPCRSSSPMCARSISPWLVRSRSSPLLTTRRKLYCGSTDSNVYVWNFLPSRRVTCCSAWARLTARGGKNGRGAASSGAGGGAGAGSMEPNHCAVIGRHPGFAVTAVALAPHDEVCRGPTPAPVLCRACLTAIVPLTFAVVRVPTQMLISGDSGGSIVVRAALDAPPLAGSTAGADDASCASDDYSS